MGWIWLCRLAVGQAWGFNLDCSYACLRKIADDLCAMTRCLSDSAKQAQEIEAFGKHGGLKVNIKKCAAIGIWYARCKQFLHIVFIYIFMALWMSDSSLNLDDVIEDIPISCHWRNRIVYWWSGPQMLAVVRQSDEVKVVTVLLLISWWLRDHAFYSIPSYEIHTMTTWEFR